MKFYDTINKLNKGKPFKVEWIFTAVTIFICFALFNQNYDLFITSQQSVAFLDSLKAGKFFEYYQFVYNKAMAGGFVTNFHLAKEINVSAYSIFLYLGLAIWNLPLWLVSVVFHVKISVFIYSYWTKAIIIVTFIFSGKLIYILCLKFNMTTNRAKWVLICFLASPVILFANISFGQFDIISVMFTLFAFIAFADKKYYKFALFISVAICFKLFAFFIFIPIILLFEKRIFQIIKYLLVCAIFPVLEHILVLFDTGYKPSMSIINIRYAFMHKFFNNGVSSGFGPVFIFGIAFVIICIYSYLHTSKNDNDLLSFAIYIPIFVYSIFFAFVSWHPQWLVIMVPFYLIAIFKSKHFEFSMLLYIMMCVAFLLMVFVFFVNNVDQSMINFGILPKLTHIHYNFSITMRKFLLSTNLPIFAFSGIFSCLTLGHIYLHFPRKADLDVQNNEVISRPIIWIYMLIIYLFIFSSVGMFVFFGK